MKCHCPESTYHRCSISNAQHAALHLLLRAGDFVVSAGHDRSLRLWERTSEPFFVEEEKEKRLESLFEADLT